MSQLKCLWFQFASLSLSTKAGASKYNGSRFHNFTAKLGQVLPLNIKMGLCGLILFIINNNIIILINTQILQF